MNTTPVLQLMFHNYKMMILEHKFVENRPHLIEDGVVY